MKKTTLRKASLLFALSSFIFVSCDKQEVESFDSQKDTPITIASAGVADLSTRAGTPAGALTSGSLSFFFNNNSGDNARYVADCDGGVLLRVERLDFLLVARNKDER